MAIDFPASPTNGQTFTSGALVYTYDGTKWKAQPAGVTGGTKIEVGNTKAEIVDTGSDGRFVVTTEGSERARVDSSGRLLVGTNTAVGGIGAGARVQVRGNTAISGGGGKLSFQRDQAASAIGVGEEMGQLVFSSNDGGDYALITARSDGASSSTSDCPGRLEFSTTADGASSPTERCRLDSSGKLLFGVTATPSASVFGVQIAPAGLVYWTSSASTTGGYTHARFFNPNGEVGSISTSSSATAFNTSSDYRLKENVVLLTGAIDRLQQIPVHRFNFIADPGKTVDGFIAHEAQAVVPECVTGTKDETKLVSAVLATDGSLLAQEVTESEWESGKIEDEEGNSRFPSDSQWVNEYEVPVYQGIDQSKLVPLLTAALQEAIAEIASLKDRVAALEAQ
jgi:hypothetical protein